jgi:mono/diheme cytochrome c family protein
MKRMALGTLSCAALVLAVLPGVTPSVTPADAGQTLFEQDCAQCHNATSTAAKVGPGLKGLFKNKTLPGTGKPTTEANVVSQIKKGGGGMPAFGDKYDAAQVGALVGYLKTL